MRRTTRQFSITLPNEMAEMVKSKVSAGEYASESEVVRDGLRLLLARDRAMESWLRDQVGPAYDKLRKDPSRAIDIERVRTRLAREHKKATAKAQ
jgi:antitoxin ParD1/3/4